jgi:hypothetical protein
MDSASDRGRRTGRKLAFLINSSVLHQSTWGRARTSWALPLRICVLPMPRACKKAQRHQVLLVTVCPRHPKHWYLDEGATETCEGFLSKSSQRTPLALLARRRDMCVWHFNVRHVLLVRSSKWPRPKPGPGKLSDFGQSIRI